MDKINSIMNIGDKIPYTLGVNQDNQEIKSSNFLGKKLIIYFYPKDMTSGCTAQACNLRDHYEDIKSLGYIVLGISIDSSTRHQTFIKKNELPFDLIADTEHSLAEQFGVWGEKKLYGKTYMGTLRTTFIFDEHGILTHKLNSKEVKTKIHAEQILEIIKQ